MYKTTFFKLSNHVISAEQITDTQILASFHRHNVKKLTISSIFAAVFIISDNINVDNQSSSRKDY